MPDRQPPQYLRTEFPLPKVKGLAVHNARKRTEAIEADCEDRRDCFNVPPPEVQSYCLFGVHPDCSVIPLASGPTATDMDPIVRRSNLLLLGKKYRLIGFVYSRTPKRRREYQAIQMPAEGGAK